MKASSLNGEAYATFLRSLAVMFRCGVALSRALELLGHSSPDPVLRRGSLELVKALRAGAPLSGAMQLQGNLFPVFHRRLIRVGERSGQLDKVLERLADYEERQLQLRLKLKQALTYPLLVFAVCLLLITLSPCLLLKNVLPLLKNGMELPWHSRCLVVYLELMSNPAVLVGGVLALGLLAFHLPPWLRRKGIWRRLRRRALHAPGLGPLLRTVAAARFARAMSVQMEAGVDVREALVLAADCSLEPELKERIRRAVTALQNGCTVAESLRVTEFFPRGFLMILQSGEEVAQFSQVFGRLADMLDSDIELRAQTFASLLEPLMMLTMGILIGAAIVSFMQPMLRLLNTLA